MATRDDLSAALDHATARFAGLVRSVGARHGLAEHELDELIQAVRVRLWRARGSSEQIEATPASYIHRTAITAALDVIRARRERQEERIDAMTEDRAALLGAVPGPDGEIEEAELAAQVGHAVDEITPSRRPVVRMYLAGYGREEIADLLGWTEGKTRNLLYRGLADLRALLTARGIGPETNQ